MSDFIIRNPTEKGNPIDQIALDRVAPEAHRRAKEYLCPECLDQKCQAGLICKAYNLIVDSFAWEIVAEKAELN